jgi:peptide/nickel transport system substrate-binding protein
MKKKLISLFLIGAMTTGMVAGCGSNSGNSNADAGNNASSDNAAVEGTEAVADGTEYF